MGSHDQVNFGGLVSLEMIARRLRSIVAAPQADVQRPHYEDSMCHRGSGGVLDAVNPELTAAGARRLKDEFEIERQRRKAAEVSGRPSGWYK